MNCNNNSIDDHLFCIIIKGEINACNRFKSRPKGSC